MDILETLFGFHILYQITCLSPCLIDRRTWTLRESTFLRIYTLLAIVVSVSYMLYSLLLPMGFTGKIKAIIEQPVKIFLILLVRFAHITSMSEGLFRHKKEKKFYEELKKVDRIFECSLNVDVKNKEFLRSTMIFGCLMAFVYLAAELYILTARASCYQKHNPLFLCFRIIPLSISGLRYFQIFTTIRILRHRFELLANILSQINLQAPADGSNKDFSPDHVQKEELKCKYSFTLLDLPTLKESKRCEMENPALKRLLGVRDLYNRLYHLNEIMNDSFGYSMLANVGSDFISITTTCYWIFYNYHDFVVNSSVFIASYFVWSLPHLLNIIVLALLCESVVQKTNRIALDLHRINVDIRNDNHNTVIHQFSLQLLHQKISISAAGFFNINCTLIYSMAGAITTYLIILIQFHMSDKTSDHNHHH